MAFNMDQNNHDIDYNDLVKSIEHWNEYRVPILKISSPDRNLNFHGAMRFYFQDAGQKVATKCVNVTSNDTTKEVIDVLIEKFRPDMRMLSVPEYGLYEIHENGDERKLAPNEKPLFVQLDWNQDDREGRFLLRRMDEKTRNLAVQNEEPSLKRKLSKKEKKKQDKLKKQHLKEQEKAEAAANKLAAKNKTGIAEKLYNELPETSFTRSISNPEAVMKRRRAQKLQKPLQEFSLEGGQEAGGTLRIFGETINKDVSYKTLLLSTKDTASHVVKQILEKYGKEDEDPNNYCLVKLIVPSSAASGDNNSVHDLNTSAGLRESILDDSDCPLWINQTHDKSRGILTFHIRPKPADYAKRRKKKTTRPPQGPQNPLHPLVVQQLNQRLQMNNNNNINNNSDQYRDQNSPQNSSQTSGSINHDINPPPPPFETVHNLPSGMYPPPPPSTRQQNGNGGMMYYQHQQPHSISTLPPRINHQIPDSMPKIQSATMQRSNFVNQNQPMVNNGQMRQSMMPNNQYPVNHHPQQPYIPTQVAGANDKILPALIQVREEVEDIFLNRVITHISPSDIPFRLAPTYVLYMVSRYRASTLFHPELQAPSRAELFMPFTRKIATMVRNTIETHARDPTYLAFWLANSSDLSHFYKQDKHLSHFTIEAQEILYDSIKASFKYLLACKQLELDAVLHSFFDERDDSALEYNNGQQQLNNNHVLHTTVDPILDVLNDTMSTMRKNRVNAALTIQIFSHLFHHVGKWLFDRLIGVYDNRPGMGMGMSGGNQPNFEVYCNRIWGEKLLHRLGAINSWAEKQGLEQAAEFHLARVTQTTLFLANRYHPQARITPRDLKDACDKCDRLNPIQMRALLRRYKPDQKIISVIIENFLYQMESTYMGDGYPLEEDFDLKIPFLIPEDGYSSELIRYIPNYLLDFVSFLSKIRVKDQELCIFTVQPTSSGHWTVYFKNHQPDAPEIIIIQLRKKDNSMGLSIIAARGLGSERLGIYIKNVVKNGAAAMDGRLHAGDQLLEVDGNSLHDLTQEQAAELMMRTGPIVTLKIAKQAAIYHNVSDIINCVPAQTVVTVPTQAHPHHQSIPNYLHQQHHHQHQQPPPPTLPHQQHLQPQPPQIMAPAPQAYVQQAPIQPLPPMSLDPMHQQQQQQQQPVLPPPPVTNSVQSLIKSPKKVSWVDTQPHQSLHTLIPLPHEPEIPEMPQSTTNGHEDLLQGYIMEGGGPVTNHFDPQPQLQHRASAGRDDDEEEDDEDDEDDDEDDDDDEDRDSGSEPDVRAHPPPSSQPQPAANGQNHTNGQEQDATTNGLADTTAESLTLEDIDEVLSSKQTNNWLEDSAGVIGTQEVYNDPRQRIVKERERTPNTDVNIEKLSFQEKLKMFNISAKK